MRTVQSLPGPTHVPTPVPPPVGFGVPRPRRADGSLLDRLPGGVLVLGVDAALRYANASARAALADGEAGLRLDGTTVRPVSSADHSAWRVALAAAAAGDVRMPRLGAQGARPRVALVPWPGRSGRPGVLCTLPLRERELAGTHAAYAAAFGLSDAESDVLVALARGAAPKSIARARGSCEGTVRSQVKAIQQKTGCCSIRELIVDVLRGPQVPQDR